MTSKENDERLSKIIDDLSSEEARDFKKKTHFNYDKAPIDEVIARNPFLGSNLFDDNNVLNHDMIECLMDSDFDTKEIADYFQVPESVIKI